MARHDRCVPNSIRIFDGKNREQYLRPESVGLERRLSPPQDGGGRSLRRRGQIVSEFRPRHCRIILASVVVWLLLVGFSRSGILLL
jgi:hypothetical protein